MLPEEQELIRLDAEQKDLGDQLASLELDLETTTVEVQAFRQRYYSAVGTLYAELDELDARIDRARLKRTPNDLGLRARVQMSEERSKQSSQEASIATVNATHTPEITPDLKRTYRSAVKLLHPDLALTEQERERRTTLMAQINLAYERGDLAEILKVMLEYGSDPEAILGEDVASRLVKTIRRIAQLKRRLDEVERGLEKLKISEIYLLKQATAEQEALGRDPLGDLARDLRAQISEKMPHADA